MKIKMKNSIINIVLVGVALLINACTNKNKVENTEKEVAQTVQQVVLSDEQLKNVKIQTTKVSEKQISEKLEVNGVLDVPPQNLTTISAVLGGTVTKVMILQGKKVKKGDVLVTIQNLEFLKLQSQFLENKQKLIYMSQENERQAELMKENVSSTKQFQQINSEYNALKAVQQTLSQELQMIGISTKTLTESNLKSEVSVISPTDGYVTEVNVNVGKFISPQEIICQIVDTRHLHAELTVFEKDISKIKIGQKLSVQLVNNPEVSKPAHVYLINKAISQDRTVRVHAHFDKEDPSLIPNMYIKATIDITNHNSLVLPSSSIVNFEGNNYIFVRSDIHTFKLQKVSIGVENEGFVQILQPNLSSLEIVSEGSYTLLSVLKNKDEE
ncbi:MAG: efflux RND transporter periplasmic adaptor subunit [Cytophagales bacterium]